MLRKNNDSLKYLDQFKFLGVWILTFFLITCSFWVSVSEASHLPSPIWRSANTYKTSSVDCGDVNGDGYPDLVFGNSEATSSLYLNLGGYFSNTTSWNSFNISQTSSVALGDMDNDGDLDLAIGIQNGPNLVYLNQNGQLDFYPVWESDDEGETLAVLWADIDGDGLLDLVCGNNGHNLAYTHKNNSPLITTYPTWISDDELKTTSLCWADLNNDGYPDLGAGNEGKNSIYFFEKGFLSESVGWQSNINTITTGIDVGDLDKDGFADLVVSSANAQLMIYYGSEDGLARDPGWYSTENIEMAALDLGDMDNDGDLDLLAVGKNSSLFIYKNNQGQLPTSHTWQSLSEPGNTFDGIFVDLDLDGDLDFATAREGYNYVYLWETGYIKNKAVWSERNALKTNALAWGDIDGDGKPDLAIGTEENHVDFVYLNTGGSEVLAASPYWYSESYSKAETSSLCWGDINGDGFQDLVVARKKAPNVVYLNQGYNLESEPSWQSTDSRETTAIALIDFDNDGDLDLAAANKFDANVLYLNQDEQLIEAPYWVSEDSFNNSGLAWGDMNRDGWQDLAVSCRLSPNLVYLNQNGDTLDSHPSWESVDFKDTTSIAWADIDGDGFLDLIAGNYNQPNGIYFNSAGTLSTTPYYFSGINDNTRQIISGDADDNGEADLFIANYNQPSFVYLNQDGTFNIDAPWIFNASAVSSVAIADVNNDQRLDMVLGRENKSDELYLYQIPSKLRIVPHEVWKIVAPGEWVVYFDIFIGLVDGLCSKLPTSCPPVFMDLEGQPEHVSWNFTPNQIPAPFSTDLQIYVSPDIQGSSYYLTVKANNYEFVAETQLQLVVEGKFSLSAYPNFQVIPNQESKTGYTVFLNTESGASLPVFLKASITPSDEGLSIEFESNNLVPPSTTKMYLNSSSDVKLGDYLIKIEGTSSSGYRTSSYSVSARVDGIPSAPIVKIKPQQPSYLDDLICEIVTPSSDPENDLISYTYKWFKSEDDGLTFHEVQGQNSSTILASLTKVGEVWKCVVTPSDGYFEGASGEDQVTIQTKTLVRIDPSIIVDFDEYNRFLAKVVIERVNDLHQYNLDLLYDPEKLSLLNVDDGGFLKSDGDSTVFYYDDSIPGLVNVTSWIIPLGESVSTEEGEAGCLCIFYFKVNDLNQLPTYLLIPEVQLEDAYNEIIPCNILNGAVGCGMKGDFNFDGYIDYLDITGFSSTWHAQTGEEDYNLIGDFNEDGLVDYIDMFLNGEADFSSVWHTHSEPPCPPPIKLEKNLIQINPKSGYNDENQTLLAIDFNPDLEGIQDATEGNPNEIISFYLAIQNVEDLKSLDLFLKFDPAEAIDVINVIPGNFLDCSGGKGEKMDELFLVEPNYPDLGILNITGSILGNNQQGCSGNGFLAQVDIRINEEFEVIQISYLDESILINSLDEFIPYSSRAGYITSDCLRGDVNQDGLILPDDALSALKIFLQIYDRNGDGIYDEPTAQEICSADYDRDGFVALDDALCILRFSLQDPC